MCSSYSGPSGTGIGAFLKDKVGGKKQVGSGITTAGDSGPSTAGMMASSYIRRKSAAPALDNIFGVNNG